MDQLEIHGSYMMNKSFEDAYSLNKIIPVYRVHVVCDVWYTNGGWEHMEVRESSGGEMCMGLIYLQAFYPCSGTKVLYT